MSEFPSPQEPEKRRNFWDWVPSLTSVEIGMGLSLIFIVVITIVAHCSR